MMIATGRLQNMHKFHHINENKEFALWLALCDIYITRGR